MKPPVSREDARADIETGCFGQDHWVVTPKLAVDIGTRFEYQGITETFRVAPRIGLAVTPFAKQQTTIRGGFGLFYDRVPLSVYSFDRYPEQLVTTYGPDGEIVSVRRFANITDKAEARSRPFVFSPNTPGNFSPYSATWNVEVEHPVNRMLRVRANYLQSNLEDANLPDHRVAQRISLCDDQCRPGVRGLAEHYSVSGLLHARYASLEGL